MKTHTRYKIDLNTNLIEEIEIYNVSDNSYSYVSKPYNTLVIGKPEWHLIFPSHEEAKNKHLEILNNQLSKQLEQAVKTQKLISNLK